MDNIVGHTWLVSVSLLAAFGSVSSSSSGFSNSGGDMEACGKAASGCGWYWGIQDSCVGKRPKPGRVSEAPPGSCAPAGSASSAAWCPAHPGQGPWGTRPKNVLIDCAVVMSWWIQGGIFVKFSKWLPEKPPYCAVSQTDLIEFSMHYT